MSSLVLDPTIFVVPPPVRAAMFKRREKLGGRATITTNRITADTRSGINVVAALVKHRQLVARARAPTSRALQQTATRLGAESAIFAIQASLPDCSPVLTPRIDGAMAAGMLWELRNSSKAESGLKMWDREVDAIRGSVPSVWRADKASWRVRWCSAALPSDAAAFFDGAGGGGDCKPRCMGSIKPSKWQGGRHGI